VLLELQATETPMFTGVQRQLVSFHGEEPDEVCVK
jgi:hypothetical protein